MRLIVLLVVVVWRHAGFAWNAQNEHTASFRMTNMRYVEMMKLIKCYRNNCYNEGKIQMCSMHSISSESPSVLAHVNVNILRTPHISFNPSLKGWVLHAYGYINNGPC